MFEEGLQVGEPEFGSDQAAETSRLNVLHYMVEKGFLIHANEMMDINPASLRDGSIQKTTQAIVDDVEDNGRVLKAMMEKKREIHEEQGSRLTSDMIDHIEATGNGRVWGERAKKNLDIPYTSRFRE